MNIREYCVNPKNCDFNIQIRCILIDREPDKLLQELLKNHYCTRHHKFSAQKHIAWQHIANLRDENLTSKLCQLLTSGIICKLDSNSSIFRPNVTTMIKMIGYFVHHNPNVAVFIWDHLSTGIGSCDSFSLCKLAEHVIIEKRWDFFSLIIEKLEKIFDPDYWRLHTWPIIDLIIFMINKRLHYSAAKLVLHIHKIFRHPDRKKNLILSDEAQLRRLIAMASLTNDVQFFKAFVRMFWIEDPSNPWCGHHADHTDDRSYPSLSLTVLETSLKLENSELFDYFILSLNPTIFSGDNRLMFRFHATLYLLEQLEWPESIQLLNQRMGCE